MNSERIPKRSIDARSRERLRSWLTRTGLLTALVCLGMPATAIEFPITEANARLQLESALVSEFGVALQGSQGVSDAVETSLTGYPAAVTGPMGIHFVDRSFEGFGGGSLSNGLGPRLVRGVHSVALDGYSVHSDSDTRALVIRSAAGDPVFRVDHIHVYLGEDSTTLSLRNGDLRITTELAALLGDPRLTGLAVGTFELDTQLTPTAAPQGPAPGPAGPGGGGGQQCVTPDFSLPVDIQLTAISSIQQSARSGGMVAITPSATLQNVGSGDVRWEATLDPDHPLLAWAMYRQTGDVFEQIGLSATKHAFFAVNDDCPCAGGSIFWAGGCTDVYGVFTNQDRGNLGPRDEIEAFTAGWNPCGSIFDANCDGIHDPAFATDPFDRRMTVQESDLASPGARYFFEAWYIVQQDIDIFNSMGWVEVAPDLSGNFWTFSPVGGFNNGPALDAWVSGGALSTTESAQRIDTGTGRVEVASRVTDVGGGEQRYEYVVMNFDFDQRVESLSIPIAASAVVSATAVSDATDDPIDDWVATVGSTDVTFSAVSGQALDWGQMVRLSITVDQAPTIETLELTAASGSPNPFSVAAPAPVPEPRALVQIVVGVLSCALGARRRALLR